MPSGIDPHSVAYVVAAFGRTDLTGSIVDQLIRDGVDPTRVVVVDNQGDFSTDQPIRLIVPSMNLGWLIATNLGMQAAFSDSTCAAVVWLNNDVEFAPGFGAALAAAVAEGVAMVGPLYDGINTHQHHRDARPDSVAEFHPGTGIRDVPWLEGTCALVTRRCYEQVGLLDSRRFGYRGYGADIDYCLRSRRMGERVLVTEAAYLTHFGGATAQGLEVDYHLAARREMSLGLRRRWGADWAERLSVRSFTPPSWAGKARIRFEEYAGWPNRQRLIRQRLRAAARVELSTSHAGAANG